MNNLSKALVLFVFVGLFFIFYNLELKAPTHSISLCQAKNLQTIQIFNHEHPEIVLKRSDSNWQIQTEGRNLVADDDAIGAYRRFVCYMPFVEAFDFPDEDESQLKAKYGISDADRVVVQTGAATDELRLGKMAPSGTEYYLQTSKFPNRIYTASNSFVENLFPDVVGLIVRFPFFELQNITKFQIEFQGSAWSFLRDENGFYFEDQNLARQNAQELAEIIYSTFFVNYKSDLTPAEKSNVSPEFYDIKIDYFDPATQQQKSWLIFKVNDSYSLLETFDNEVYLLILTPEKMVQFEARLIELIQAQPKP